MAISNNPIMQGVRGAINKQIVFRIVNHRQIVSAYPDMDGVKRTAKQKKQSNRLIKANEIIAAIKSDPITRDAAQLRLNVPSNRLHHALLQDVLLALSKEETVDV
jgi:hypothetical protein